MYKFSESNDRHCARLFRTFATGVRPEKSFTQTKTGALTKPSNFNPVKTITHENF